MVILRLVELLVSFILVGGIISQVLWPLLTQTKIFPLFRGNLSKLEEEQAEVNQLLAEQAVADEIAGKFKGIHSDDVSAKAKVEIAKQYVAKQ